MADQKGVAEAAWRERLTRFSGSGLTVKAFCRREGVSSSNYFAWKRRLGIGTPSASSPSPAEIDSPKESLFVPVSLIPMASQPEVRIVLPGGAVVHLPGEVNERVWAVCVQAVVAATRVAEEVSC